MARAMRAEVISIGDELTSGQRLDTNSQWLSQQLGELGVRTLFHTTVADDMESNLAAFRIAARRVDLIICTGGLGPTADDLTRQAIADAFDRPLEFHAPSLAHIESLFARRHRAMPERNQIQAYFPQGSEVVPNQHGTAPGIDLTVPFEDGHSCRIFALPGVPAEMIEMWEQTVQTRLKHDFGLGNERLYYHALKLFGLGESDIEATIPDLIARDREPRVGVTASRATLTLRIATSATCDDEAQKKMQPTIDLIRQSFGLFVFGTGDQELHDVIAIELAKRHQSLLVLEVGESSMIGDWFSNIQPKPSELKVRHELFPNFDSAMTKYPFISPPGIAPDSIETLQSFAKNLQRQVGCDWVLLAGPYPALATLKHLDERDEASFRIVLAGPNDTLQGRRIRPAGHPELVLHRTAKQALDDLRRQLIAL